MILQGTHYWRCGQSKHAPNRTQSNYGILTLSEQEMTVSTNKTTRNKLFHVSRFKKSALLQLIQRNSGFHRLLTHLIRAINS
jgi:hypothetical protein